MGRGFREGVVAVVTDGAGRYLVGERAAHPGAWQFPQGGIDTGESPEEALFRELEEETGIRDAVIVARGSAPVAYAFPEEIARRLKSAGQRHHWFLLRLHPGAGPDVAKADGEFARFDWLDLRAIVAGIIDWKRAAYRQGLASLGLETPE